MTPPLTATLMLARSKDYNRRVSVGQLASWQKLVGEMTHKIEAIVCGYHMYMEILVCWYWRRITLQMEPNSNPFAVADSGKTGSNCSHIPRKISSVC